MHDVKVLWIQVNVYVETLGIAATSYLGAGGGVNLGRGGRGDYLYGLVSSQFRFLGEVGGSVMGKNGQGVEYNHSYH